jgi:hypothetical protein
MPLARTLPLGVYEGPVKYIGWSDLAGKTKGRSRSEAAFGPKPLEL